MSAIVFSETVTHDDLAGLRPNTQGVETNAFWDTRGQAVYNIGRVTAASSRTVKTAFRTRSVSAPQTLDSRTRGTVIIFR